jgi:hypothetical protein
MKAAANAHAKENLLGFYGHGPSSICMQWINLGNRSKEGSGTWLSF